MYYSDSFEVMAGPRNFTYLCKNHFEKLRNGLCTFQEARSIRWSHLLAACRLYLSWYWQVISAISGFFHQSDDLWSGSTSSHTYTQQTSLTNIFQLNIVEVGHGKWSSWLFRRMTYYMCGSHTPHANLINFRSATHRAGSPPGWPIRNDAFPFRFDKSWFL